jgi:hypothetical protein
MGPVSTPGRARGCRDPALRAGKHNGEVRYLDGKLDITFHDDNGK